CQKWQTGESASEIDVQAQQFHEGAEKSALKYGAQTRQISLERSRGKDISQDIDAHGQNHGYPENDDRLECESRLLSWIAPRPSASRDHSVWVSMLPEFWYRRRRRLIRFVDPVCGDRPRPRFHDRVPRDLRTRLARRCTRDDAISADDAPGLAAGI